MSADDIRWKQRLNNYSAALKQLQSGVQLGQTKILNNLEKQGLIQAFKFTHELAWNVMKDYFFFQGNSTITGSRDASREAFQKGLVMTCEIWMEMIQSRNKTSHTYNQEIAEEIVTKIQNHYLLAFLEFEKKMNELSGSNL